MIANFFSILLMVISLSLILCAVAAAIAALSRNRQQPLPTVDNTTSAGYDIHYHPPREQTAYYTEHCRDRSL